MPFVKSNGIKEKEELNKILTSNCKAAEAVQCFNDEYELRKQLVEMRRIKKFRSAN